MSVINLSHLWQEHNEREHLLEGKWLLINISSAKMYLDVSQYFGEPFMLLPQMWSYYWFVLILPPWVFFFFSFLKRQSQRVTQGWVELNLCSLSDLLIPLKCMLEWKKKIIALFQKIAVQKHSLENSICSSGFYFFP